MIYEFATRHYGLGLARPATVSIRPRLTVRRIQEVVAGFYQIPQREMTSQRRDREFSWPRQVAMNFAREMTPKSLPDIGRLFGDRDHTTVIHACRAVRTRCDGDADYAVDVQVMRERLAG